MYIYDYKIFEELTHKEVFKDLSKPKRKHSKKVAKFVKQLTNDKDVEDAAYYHDYIERVGYDEKLKDILSFKSFNLVNILTHEYEEENVLVDLKLKLSEINNKEVIENVIILKICDRTDNLLKRRKKGDLSKKYIKKSAKLIQYLYDLSENRKPLETFILENLNKIPKLIKRLKL